MLTQIKIKQVQLAETKNRNHIFANFTFDSVYNSCSKLLYAGQVLDTCMFDTISTVLNSKK